MKEIKFNSESGISLVEILIVIVICAILVTFAVARFSNAKTSLQRQNVARELKVSFERARFDSVKRRALETDSPDKRAKVKVDATNFEISIDRNLSGTIDTSDTRQVNFGSNGDIRIVSSTLSLPVTVRFDYRGQIVATDSTGATVTPKFIICNNCTAATATAQNATIVSISSTGTIVMTAFGDSEPTFQNPSVSNSPSETNPLVQVETSTGASPVPSPTASQIPIVTPTPTPTSPGTPTSTPTPTPVPTPTPTPTNICKTNERPDVTGCTCKSPMIIHTNKKCYQ
jgi:Tfp pilus assembly protein FimT